MAHRGADHDEGAGPSLRGWLVPLGGFVFGSEVKFVLTARRGRKPDVSAFFPGCGALPRRGGVRLPPGIAVSVLSPRPRDTRRERLEKADEYASFGVRYFWLVDPQQRTLEIFELGADGRYVRARAAGEGVVDEVPGCEGLKVDLDALWAEIDRLGPDDPIGAGED